jgi:hypothetical protein
MSLLHRLLFIASLFSMLSVLAGCPSSTRQAKNAGLSLTREPKTMDDLNHPGWYDRTTRKVLKRGVLTKTLVIKQCLKKYSTSVEHANCVYGPWLRGSQIQRISMLHELVLSGARGHATMLVLFRKENVPFRKAFSDHVLAYVAHLDALPLDALARYYRDSRDTFRAAFDALGVKTRIRAAQKLVVALGLTTPKAVSGEFSGYLKFSSRWLWQRIRVEKDLSGFLTLTSLSKCGQGLPPYKADYREGVLALYGYYLRWKDWQRAVTASGVSNYQSIIKILDNQLTIAQLRGINATEFRKAMRLTKELQTLRKQTEQTILFVSERTQRGKLLKWFRWLVQKSPIVRNPRR